MELKPLFDKAMQEIEDKSASLCEDDRGILGKFLDNFEIFVYNLYHWKISFEMQAPDLPSSDRACRISVEKGAGRYLFVFGSGGLSSH